MLPMATKPWTPTTKTLEEAAAVRRAAAEPRALWTAPAPGALVPWCKDSSSLLV